MEQKRYCDLCSKEIDKDSYENRCFKHHGVSEEEYNSYEYYADELRSEFE